MGDNKSSGKKAVNRHRTQSKTSASNQERAIEKVQRQASKKLAVDECAHETEFVTCDGMQHTEVCSDCNDDLSYSACPEAWSVERCPSTDSRRGGLLSCTSTRRSRP